MSFIAQLIRLCLVTIFIFYFKKLVFENRKKKQFSCIFEIKIMFGQLKLKIYRFLKKKQKILKYVIVRIRTLVLTH